MSIESDRKQLAQKKTLKWIQRELDPNEWITVLKTPSEDSQGCSVYSTLIPLDKVEYHRSHLGNYYPPSDLVFFTFPHEEVQETIGIDRDLDENQYLIIDRNRDKIEGKEIHQDFRLLYNLYPNADTDECYLKDFATPNKIVVAVVESDCVRIRFRELKGFLKSKGLYLSLRFGFTEYSKHSLSELGVRQNEVESDEMELKD